jgi:hypothetical protein
MDGAHLGMGAEHPIQSVNEILRLRLLRRRGRADQAERKGTASQQF